jgi:hypothetical protein
VNDANEWLFEKLTNEDLYESLGADSDDRETPLLNILNDRRTLKVDIKAYALLTRAYSALQGQFTDPDITKMQSSVAMNFTISAMKRMCDLAALPVLEGICLALRPSARGNSLSDSIKSFREEHGSHLSADNLSQVLEGELLFNKWLVTQDPAHVGHAKMLFKTVYNDIKDAA